MPDDPAVIAGEVRIPADDTDIIGYLARPSVSLAPVILVCRELRTHASHPGYGGGGQSQLLAPPWICSRRVAAARSVNRMCLGRWEANPAGL
jgi:hypothetical protein